MTEEAFSCAEERSRYCAYTKMTEACRHVAIQFRDDHIQLAELDLLRCYDLGAELNTIAARPGMYGTEAVQQLAEYMSFSESDVYLMRQMAGEFPRSVVEEAAERTTIEGWHLTSRHFLLVVGVKSESERMERLENLFTHPLSRRDLERQIKALGFEKKKRSRGRRRPETGPLSATPLRTFLDIAQRSASFNDRVDRWAGFVFDAVDEMPPDQITDRHVVAIRAAIDQVKHLSVNVEHTRQRSCRW